MSVISPFFAYSFNGLIFKILPDTSLSFLALEVRNLQTKEVSFAVVDYQKGALLFEGLGLDETWWVGMAGFSNGNLFFHHFADKEYPEAQALLMANVLEQSLVWEKKGGYLEEITQDGVWISFLENGQKKYQLLDTASGNVIQQSNILEEQSESTEEKKRLIFPSQYEESTPYFSTVAQFLKQKLNVIAIKQIDYCEFGDKIVIAYASVNQRFLFILNTIGEILFHQSILQDSQGLGMESFFIVNDCLISVANREKLLIFRLNSSN